MKHNQMTKMEPANESMLEDRFHGAMQLFDAGQYQDTFSEFVSLYEVGFQPEIIMDLLTECFYAPNVEALRANYEQNVALLRQYPYVWGDEWDAFDQLPFLLFPVCDGVYVSFDKTRQQFQQRYEPEAREAPTNLFPSLEKPLLLENECQLSTLQYLNDTVRRSEDFAGDNHIYLYYEDASCLALLLQVALLEALLASKKFVFLMGPSNKKRYPIDFKKEFGYAYQTMKPQPLRIEEMTRICLWYKHAYSGTDLSLDVLRRNDYTVVYKALEFHTNSRLQGIPMYFHSDFRAAMQDVNREYSIASIRRICQQEGNSIELPLLEPLLQWLEETYPDQERFTIAFLFRAYFLLQYQREHGNRRTRIAPVIVFDPHMWDTRIFNPLIESFPYSVVLTCMREPVMTFARAYEYGLVVWNEFQTRYILASEYSHAQFLNAALQKRYFAYRFEDLKQFPKQVCQAICRLLNIPYLSKMLKADAPVVSPGGKTVRGFDTTPLHHTIDGILSDFDRLRLQIFYEPILRYYGYPLFDSQEYPLSEEEIKQMFSYPFRFERHYRERYKENVPDEAELHQWIQEVLSMRLSDKAREQIIFPRLLALEE